MRISDFQLINLQVDEHIICNNNLHFQLQGVSKGTSNNN